MATGPAAAAARRPRTALSVISDAELEASGLFRVPVEEDVFLEYLGGPAAGDGPQAQVTLLLIHGSYRAAWCWEPYFLDFFRSHGFHTYALSLRGQGRGFPRMRKPPAVAGTLEVHAADVVAFADYLRRRHDRPVAILGHSFGGLIAQRAAADAVERRRGLLAGLALLGSVPPSGNGGLILRYLLRSPLLAFRITWAFVTRAFERDVKLCRELFFEPEVSDEDVSRYMAQMQEGCPAGTRLLDLRELAASLPVPAVGAAAGGPPVLVVGGDADVIVDAEALDETARAHHTSAVVLPGVAHDSMLGPRWQLAADAILKWLQALTPAGK